MARRYFGTDGVRGKVGTEPITPELVMKLGFAAGRVLVGNLEDGSHGRESGSRSGRPTVLIGKDTRISGYMLEAALQAGFTAAGMDVLLLGPIPTPAVAYLTRALRLDAGVVISASHNPYDDNGIKFFSGDGNKLPDALEERIEQELEQPMGCVRSDLLGRAKRIDDAQGRYIEFCKGTFPANLDLKGLRLVVDCANGASYHTAPHVFHELGAEVITLGVGPNGFNINDKVGATHPASLIAGVKAHRADLGIALDGDADRVLVVDAAGRLYDGDELLYAIVRDRMLSGERVEGVAGTLMTNLALEQALARHGIELARAKVGDRYVLEALLERGWKYGGENSGHILCLDRHTTGDGTISALQVLTAIRRNGLALADLVSDLALFPQKMINVRVAKGFDWQNHAGLKQARAEVESRLGADGRVLIRPSGTEPLLRLMVEARDGKLADQGAKALAAAIG